MNKTLKQIADELGIDKQRVYRFVKKNNITEVHQEVHQGTSAKLYDEVAQEQIIQAFSKSDEHQEVHRETHQNHINDAMFDALLKQLEEKDRQIEKLQKALDQAQHLQAAAEQRVAQLEAPATGTEEKTQKDQQKSWLQKLRGK